MAHKVSFWNRYRQLDFSEKSLGILYFVALVPCVFFFLQGLNARIGLSFLNPNIRLEIYILLVALCIKKMSRVLNVWDYLFVIGVGAFCFWSPSIYPKTSEAVKEFAPYFVFSCLPFYFIGRTFQLDKYYELIIYIGRIGLVLSILFFLLVSLRIITRLAGLNDDNMFYAYLSLPSVIILLCSELRKHNLTDFILVVLGMAQLLALGTRGPCVLCMAFICIFLFFKEVKHKWLFMLGLFFLLIIIMLFSAYLFEILNNIVLMLGGSNRVIEHMQGNNLVNSYNRDWIYEIIIYEISRGDVFGSGFFYDRTILGMEQGSYCHNFFLEIWLDFGLYIGSFLLFILMAMISFNLIKNKEGKSRQLYLSFFFALFGQLIFSSSYLESPNFWLFIGVTVASIKNINMANGSSSRISIGNV